MDQQTYNPDRKIATIMAAGLVAGEGQKNTLDALKLSQTAFEHFVKEFGGRSFGMLDESFMAEFPSVFNSVRCAVNLQAAMRVLNESLADYQRIELRIALNLGDVISQGTELFGKGVDIAARLEPLADTGGICIAGNVYKQVHQKIDLNYHFIGAQTLNNIDTPITAFKLLSNDTVKSSMWQEFVRALTINQGFRYQLLLISVLTLLAIGYAPSIITETRISVLAQGGVILGALLYAFSQFKKIRTPFINKPATSTIDATLIQDSLIDIKNKFQDIGHSFNSTEKTESVLTSIAVLRFADHSPEQDQAYFSDGLCEELINVLSKSKNLDVASRTSSFAYTPEEFNATEFAEKLGVDYFIEGSVRKVHNRVRILAQLIDVKSNSQIWSETYDRVMTDIFEIQDDISAHIAESLQIKFNPKQDKESLTSDSRAYDFYLRGRAFFGYKGIENIRYAIQMYSMAAKIDPKFVRAWTDLAETYAIQAIYYDGGEPSKQKAKETAGTLLLLAPERGETYVALGMAHMAQQEYALAAGRFEKAININPLLFEAHHNYARTHYHQGNLKEAIRYFHKAADIDPADFESYALSAPLYTALGDEKNALNTYQQGLERIRKYIENYPENQRAFQLGAICYLKLGENQKATEWAEQALSLAPEEPATLYNLACFFAQAGEIDRAFECLAASITSRSWIENDPELEPLRKDPRYLEIISRLNA